MNVIITPHLIQRANDRGIDPEQILGLLDSGTLTLHKNKKGSWTVVIPGKGHLAGKLRDNEYVILTFLHPPMGEVLETKTINIEEVIIT